MAVAQRTHHLSLLTPSFGCADGYGNAAEQMALALEKRNCKISLAGHIARTGKLNAQHIYDRATDRSDEAIVFFSFPHLWSRQRDRKAYGFTMYEADRVPDPWIAPMINVDEVWVPSIFNAEVFARVSPRDVHVIPLGVDAKAFGFKRRARGEKLRFLHFATATHEARKGFDLAQRAFLDAFPDRDDVELVLRSTLPSNYRKEPDARIISHGGSLSTAELADYYRTFDALIFPSRGEGFGLIPLEAMATGMPAIFTAATGMADYADLGLPVDGHPVPATVGRDRGHDSNEPFGTWFEPRVYELVDRMRTVDTAYERVMDCAEQDAKTIAKKWSWDRTARAILARLEA